MLKNIRTLFSNNKNSKKGVCDNPELSFEWSQSFRFPLQENELSSVITWTAQLACTHRELSFVKKIAHLVITLKQ